MYFLITFIKRQYIQTLVIVGKCLCLTYRKLDEKETDDENQNVQKKRDRMKYSTESSDEITDTIHVDSETEIDF